MWQALGGVGDEQPRTDHKRGNSQEPLRTAGEVLANEADDGATRDAEDEQQ